MFVPAQPAITRYVEGGLAIAFQSQDDKNIGIKYKLHESEEISLGFPFPVSRPISNRQAKLASSCQRGVSPGGSSHKTHLPLNFSMLLPYFLSPLAVFHPKKGKASSVDALLSHRGRRVLAMHTFLFCIILASPHTTEQVVSPIGI